LSQNHKISIITSIHQPNNDILMMFDKLYVLSKGGICVYSGPPQQLNTHLSGCGIICNEFQTPIEVLLKYSSIGIEDKHVLNLVNKTSLEKDVILIRCKDETILFPDGIQNKSKRFKLIDLWILLLRTMTYTYRYFWKFLLMQFVLYIGFAYFLISIIISINDKRYQNRAVVLVLKRNKKIVIKLQKNWKKYRFYHKI